MKNTVVIVRPTVAETLQLFYRLKKSGTIFSGEFIKNDNSKRKMKCRTGVKKYCKGGTLPYVAAEKGLLPVFDMDKLEYRMFNLNTVLWVEHGGRRYVWHTD